MDTWNVGTIAAVIAAAAGVITAFGVGLTWYYSHRAASASARAAATSDRALRYERLREARELVGRMDRTGGLTRYSETNEAAAQLRAVLVTLERHGDFGATRRLADISWNQTNYGSGETSLPSFCGLALVELERETGRLASV